MSNPTPTSAPEPAPVTDEQLAEWKSFFSRRWEAGVFVPAAHGAIPTLIAEVERLRADNARLCDALRGIYDEQNGPPLIRRQAQWEAAMTKTRACLEEYER